MNLSRKEKIIRAIDLAKIPYQYISKYDSDAGYFEYIGREPTGLFSFLKKPEVIARLEFEMDKGEWWITNNISLYAALESFGFKCKFQSFL